MAVADYAQIRLNSTITGAIIPINKFAASPHASAAVEVVVSLAAVQHMCSMHRVTKWL
jgi:hypothetical protein